MVACCGTIAFHIYKDDCPTVIIIFHRCYSAILLKYPVVVDHRYYYLCIAFGTKKNIVNTSVILVIEVVSGDG